MLVMQFMSEAIEIYWIKLWFGPYITISGSHQYRRDEPVCENQSHAIWKHYDDVTWTSINLKSPTTRLFVEQLMWAHIKETSKSALLALCEGNSLVTGEFPAQMASNAEKSSIWWRHNERQNQYYVTHYLWSQALTRERNGASLSRLRG